MAARRFATSLTSDQLASTTRIVVDLYGSLAKTGKGHGTDIAVQLGLIGEDPTTIAQDEIDRKLEEIKHERQIHLLGKKNVPFDIDADIIFHFDTQLPMHPNGLRLTTWSGTRKDCESTFYSVGGGFVVMEGESQDDVARSFPFPIDRAEDLLRHCERESMSISDVVMRNEKAILDEDQIGEQLLRITNVMFDSIHRGCRTEGRLPGGLNVQRRAPAMAKRLLGRDVPPDRDRWINAVAASRPEFSTVLDWVSCFALAVNEENAAFGRVVTAPTNGAAGVVPAVLLYATCFCDLSHEAQNRFLLTASEVGCIFKKGATISAALGGCQAEIGVSSAMAAAALTESLGGTPMQSAEAAEIAMEHHLGMTCDPIGGLVQIPCIERNAMGAVKAIAAAQLAMQRPAAEACVSLDDVVRTMWQTAQDMNEKYKETSEGGLAVQISVNVSEC